MAGLVKRAVSLPFTENPIFVMPAGVKKNRAARATYANNVTRAIPFSPIGAISAKISTVSKRSNSSVGDFCWLDDSRR